MRLSTAPKWPGINRGAEKSSKEQRVQTARAIFYIALLVFSASPGTKGPERAD
jgi:hypothetical protein